jgi:hypothetical protein
LFGQSEPHTEAAARIQILRVKLVELPGDFVGSNKTDKAESPGPFETIFRLPREHIAIPVAADLVASEVLFLKP